MNKLLSDLFSRTVYENPASIRGMFGLTDTRNCTHGSGTFPVYKYCYFKVYYKTPNLN